MVNYLVTTLRNGLTCILCPFENFRSVYFDLAVRVGVRYEAKNMVGLSHLTEHLVATSVINSLKKHPWQKHFVATNNFHAYSLVDRTNFEFTIDKKNFASGITFLKKILRLSNISHECLQTEKLLVQEEYMNAQEDSKRRFYDFIDREYFGQNPLAHPISGKTKNLDRFSLDDVRAWRAQYYVPTNMILTVAGGISHDSFQALMNNAFSSFSNLQKRPVTVPFVHRENKVSFFPFSSNQIHFVFYLPVTDISAEKNLRFEFLVGVLNEYIFYTLQAKSKVYSVQVDSRTYEEFFNFAIESAFSPEKTIIFVKSFFHSLSSFLPSFKPKDLNYAKAKFIERITIDSDYPKENANMIAWYAFMFGTTQILDFAEQEKIISRLTIRDIHADFQSLVASKGALFVGGKLNNTLTRSIERLWNVYRSSDAIC